MARSDQVKQYFAFWFQVGKPAICPKGDRQILPKVVQEGNTYSSDFETCWQILNDNDDCYLEGTNQSLADLLSEQWEIASCPRCTMRVALSMTGQNFDCPCADLTGWPNLEMPTPHCPYQAGDQLAAIHQRLRERQHQTDL